MDSQFKKFYFSNKNFKKIIEMTKKFLFKKYDFDFDERSFGVWDEVKVDCFNTYVYNSRMTKKVNLIKLNTYTIQTVSDLMTEFIKEETNKKYGGTTIDIEERLDREKKERNVGKERKDKKSFIKSIKVEADSEEVMNKKLDEYLEMRKNDDEKIRSKQMNRERPDFSTLNDDSELPNSDVQDAFIHEDTQELDNEEHLIIKKSDEITKKIEEYKTERQVDQDHYLLIDSRSRNYDNHPEPNNYDINFNKTFNDILEIELISANIPKSEYNINNSNNTIHFNVSSTDYTAVLSNGNYDISTLMSDLETVMNGVGSGVTFTITEDTKTNKITISGSGSFDLLFIGGTEKIGLSTRTKYLDSSIGYTIGFKREDLTGNTTYTAQNIYNLNGENYVLLYIQDLENINTGNYSVSGVSNSYAKINLDTDVNTTKYYSSNSDYVSKITFTVPKQTMSRMEIMFYNYNGSLYDFNGLEHSLYFKFKTLNVDWTKY